MEVILLWLLLSCGEEPDSISYCPESSFEEAVIDAYCTNQEQCGWYESKSVCVADQDWTLDCGDGLYNPRLAQPCIDAILAYEDGCGMGLSEMFALDGISGASLPGVQGCGYMILEDEEKGFKVADKLCVAPEDATESCVTE